MLSGGGVTLISLALANPAQAASITTTFVSTTGASSGGNMFDITTFGNALNVTSLEVNVDTTGTFNLDVYTKSGTYVGSQTNSGAWTLVSSATGITGQGQDNRTFVDIPDFTLAANSVTGIYVATNTTIRYTSGANTFSNGDLQLDLGAGIGGLFGNVFTPRTWNGTITYDVQASATTPEPATLLGLMVFGGGLLASKRKKES